MSKEEIRAYLMRWVMEFGDGPVGVERHKNVWYTLVAPCAYSNARTRQYFSDTQRGEVRINQAGLALIKGDTYEQLSTELPEHT